MRTQQDQWLNVLLIVIVLAALGGGLAIVYVTSPQSFQLARWFGPPATAAPASATVAPTPSPSPTPLPDSPTPSQAGPLSPITISSTPTPSPSPATATPRAGSPTAAASPTRLILPPDVRALARVTDRLGSSTARVRDVPGGAVVIAALPAGTEVQVLFGQAVVSGIEWVEVRLASGRTGWIASFLLEFITELATLAPGTATAAPPTATPVPPTSPPGATAPPPPPPPTATRTPTTPPSATLSPSATATASATTAPTATDTDTPQPTPTETDTPAEPPPSETPADNPGLQRGSSAPLPRGQLRAAGWGPAQRVCIMHDHV